MHRTIKKYFFIPVVIDIFAAADDTEDQYFFTLYVLYYNPFAEKLPHFFQVIRVLSKQYRKSPGVCNVVNEDFVSLQTVKKPHGLIRSLLEIKTYALLQLGISDRHELHLGLIEVAKDILFHRNPRMDIVLSRPSDTDL